MLMLKLVIPLALTILFADYSDPDVIRVGEDYYLVASSFQCVRGAYGRIVHRQPMTWINDWPEMGEPVEDSIAIPLPASDDFNGPRLGLQWQWHGNPKPDFFTLRSGVLRLSPVPDDLRDATNLLLQKFPAPSFTATTRVDASPLRVGERAGVVVMGTRYAALEIARVSERFEVRVRGKNEEPVSTSALLPLTRTSSLHLRVAITPEAVARFSYSYDGQTFTPIGAPFVASPGRWIGAKVGLFGPADFDDFHVETMTPAENASLVVAQDGSGDFRTIQEAVDAIPHDNDDNRTILIKRGTYREKVMIERSHIALVGEDRDGTRIEFAELRRNWRATHPDDWGAAVINIGPASTDVVIANLTVRNDYGSQHGDHDHQFAIRSMGESTRIAILNANVIADGGDTLSLWNAESGLSYYADSYFEGHVDFVAPRGWAYATNSRFFGRNLTAAIWHDGSRDRDQKFVIRHSRFDRAVRIALVGDSTVTEKSGWGRGFKAHVAESAALLNLARGGRSSKSFINEGHWGDALSRKPTHVLIQFGHNDQPGKGADRETDLPSYRANLSRYVDDARSIGAKPILVTPLTRRNSGPSDLQAWADATKEVAAAKDVPLIDLYAKSIALLGALGPSVSASIGPLKSDGTFDRTHLNEEGSALFGAVMIEETRRAAPELSAHIRPVGQTLLSVPPSSSRKRPGQTGVSVLHPPWSVRMADSVMKRTPDPMWLDANEAPRWEYTPGLVLKGVMHVAERTGDARYWKYVEAYYDGMIDDAGAIRGGYKLEDYNIDRINPGKALFTLYARTKNGKYRKAIELLRRQMREHPRTSEGGFWHKKRYPHQMWLDGLYMGAPFLAQYAKTFNEPALFDDVITQFVLMEKHARDAKTGLLFHGWDESRQQKWADPKTGRSPAFWGRAMGWYAMGLVETLDYIPLEHPRRRELIAILTRLAEAIVKVQDPKSGVWWQVVDRPGRDGNYREASVSTMFAFALLKAARMRYLDATYEKAGRRAYAGVLKEFIEVDKDGVVNIHRVCQVAGLGGDPEKGERYRDGTYEYYVTERIRSNDPKAVGPFIFASLEMEKASR